MKPHSIVALLMISQAGVAHGGILSGHAAVRCGASPENAADCDGIRASRLEGRFGMLLGLDGSFSAKSPENTRLTYEGPASSGTGSNNNKSNTTSIKLGSSSGFRFGSSLRLHIMDGIGLAFDAGYAWNGLGTDDQDQSSQSSYGQTSLDLSYGGSYVGGTIFFPPQKTDKLGMFASLRRYSVSEADVTMRQPYGQESKYTAKALAPVQELSVGFFVSVFYLSYAVRDESWQINGTETEKFSPIKSRASGVEIGASGSIWYLWP